MSNQLNINPEMDKLAPEYGDGYWKEKYLEVMRILTDNALNGKPTLASFKKLALGARFKYANTNKVYVKIGHDLIASWDESNIDTAWVGQGVYSFSDDGDGNTDIDVELCEKNDWQQRNTADTEEEFLNRKLPCDIKIGCGINKAGTSIRTLLLRANNVIESKDIVIRNNADNAIQDALVAGTGFCKIDKRPTLIQKPFKYPCEGALYFTADTHVQIVDVPSVDAGLLNLIMFCWE